MSHSPLLLDKSSVISGFSTELITQSQENGYGEYAGAGTDYFIMKDSLSIQNDDSLPSIKMSDLSNRQRTVSSMESVQLTRSLSMQWNEEQEQRFTKEEKKSPVIGAVFNFTNSIVGAGIIGLPYALHRSGFWWGLFLLIFVSLIIDYGVRNLVACGVKRNKLDYELIVENTYGKLGYYTVTICMFFFALGAMIAYHIIIGDTVSTVIKFAIPNIAEPFGERWFIVCTFSLIFMLPLSLLKNMSALAWTSGISVFAVFVIIAIVTVEAPESDSDVDHSESLPVFRSHWFSGVGTMSFAFVCHHSSFIVRNSLLNANEKRWAIVTHSSVGLSLFLSLVLSIVSYIAFRETVDSDVLNNFSYENIAVNVARILLAITMVFTYPMEAFVSRHCIMELLESTNVIHLDPILEAKQYHIVLYFVTVVLWMISLSIGASVDDLGIVLELNGSLAASMLGYILPGLVILKVNNLWVDRRKKWKTLPFFVAMFTVVFGVVVMVMGTALVFI